MTFFRNKEISPGKKPESKLSSLLFRLPPCAIKLSKKKKKKKKKKVSGKSKAERNKFEEQSGQSILEKGDNRTNQTEKIYDKK